tara:strand:+ start:1877 stop:1987 length:111 start_codon:yes stop_codon:yes gene_type:complete
MFLISWIIELIYGSEAIDEAKKKKMKPKIRPKRKRK